VQNLPKIQPMQLSRIATPFDHPDFLFELKHDGFRALAYISDRKCSLISRKNHAYKSFAPLREALGRLRVKTAILDGEIVVLDSEGKSQFKPLLHRHGQASFYAFDMVWLNGEDLRLLPLVERKEQLRKLIFRSQIPGAICAGHVDTYGKALFEEVCSRDLEGIVCKKKNSVYALGGAWLKVKNPSYSQAKGRHEMFTAFRERSALPVDRVQV
jgi:bifunctional non-homologous end joining protein LigD